MSSVWRTTHFCIVLLTVLQCWTNNAQSTFQAFSSPKTWQDAENDCVAKGGHLASVQNDADMDAIIDATTAINLQPLPTTGDWLWTGGKLQTNLDRTSLVWSDGTSNAFSQTIWESNEPNGDGRCVDTHFTTGLASHYKKLNDGPCTFAFPYVCQFVETNAPSATPSLPPSSNPSSGPSANPSSNPTSNPTTNPTKNPTANPTRNPTTNPTRNPTTNPTRNPTTNPTRNPTGNPTSVPTINPSSSPTSTPTSSVTVADLCNCLAGSKGPGGSRRLLNVHQDAIPKVPVKRHIVKVSMNDDIHLWHVCEGDNKFAELKAFVEKTWNVSKFKMVFQDEEGDMINLNSEKLLITAFDIANNRNDMYLKVFVR